MLFRLVVAHHSNENQARSRKRERKLKLELELELELMWARCVQEVYLYRTKHGLHDLLVPGPRKAFDWADEISPSNSSLALQAPLD